MTTTPLTHILHDSGVPAEARDFSVEERVVIVTGAAQGIGRELARQFAAAGAVAVVADLNIDGADAVVAEIHDAGGIGLAVRVNVADETSVQAMVDTVVEKFGASTCWSTTPPSSRLSRRDHSTRSPWRSGSRC